MSIPLLDLTPTLRDLEIDGTRLYWNYDEHIIGYIYLAVGGILYEWWSDGRAARTRH